MPALLPRSDTTPLGGLSMTILLVLIVVGFLATVTIGGFVVWVVTAGLVVAIGYAIIARGWARWTGRR